PVLDGGVEAARREEEQRRPVAEDLVARLDAVADRGRHQSPRTGRAARTSARNPSTSSSLCAARTRPSSHGPPPRPPTTAMNPALTAASPASGPEWREAVQARPP